MKKKALVSVVYIIMAILVIQNREHILLWINDDSQYAWIGLSLAAIIIALIPVLPFGIIGGIIGAKYGIYIGGLINVISSTIAAIILFLVIRYLFQERVRSMLSKNNVVNSFTLSVEKHPFMFIFIGRLIPVIPAIVINSYTALSRISIYPFALATLLGKIPVMLLFSVVGEQFVHQPNNMAISIAIYSLLLLLIVLLYKKYINNKSLR